MGEGIPEIFTVFGEVIEGNIDAVVGVEHDDWLGKVITLNSYLKRFYAFVEDACHSVGRPLGYCCNGRRSQHKQKY